MKYFKKDFIRYKKFWKKFFQKNNSIFSILINNKNINNKIKF